MSAQRKLFRVTFVVGRVPRMKCNVCGASVIGRQCAVWHAKKHEARGEASDIPDARCTWPVEERYQVGPAAEREI